MERCVFLDRDNTIIANDGDLGDPDQVRILAGAAFGIRAIREAGYLVVVVTNQGGVARGKYTERAVDAVHARASELLSREAAWTRVDPLINQWRFCPFHPDGTVAKFSREDSCRKPAPGMLIAASTALSIDLKVSWMVGDQERDVAAGQAAGCRTIRILDPIHEEVGARARSAADFIASDLLHASHRILRVDCHDGAPIWAATHAMRIRAAPGSLARPSTRAMVESAAHALAEREGVHIARIEIDEEGVEVEVVGEEIVAVGFVAELRSSTNRWAASNGMDQLWASG
ncbi:MAG: HAD-IIIA family hydrolase [Phycisphaerales bacterium]|nr:HAD-IIIA family hydrolase [Phycisphaerales bacterium]